MHWLRNQPLSSVIKMIASSCSGWVTNTVTSHSAAKKHNATLDKPLGNLKAMPKQLEINAIVTPKQ